MKTLSTHLQRTSALSRGLAALGLAAGVWALSVAATPAQARSDVYWSVGVNGPGVSIGASNAPVVVHQPPVYYAPPAYYHAPRPVYYEPRPVYHAPRPVVIAPPVVHLPRPPALVVSPPVVYAPPVVIGGAGYWRERPGRWDDDRRGHRHGHRHGHRPGRDWDDDGHRGRR